MALFLEPIKKYGSAHSAQAIDISINRKTMNPSPESTRTSQALDVVVMWSR